MTLLAKVARHGPADLLMVAEAMVLLAFFRLCLAVVPVRRIIGAITHGKAEPKQADSASGDAVSIDGRELSAAQRVQWAVVAVARHSVVEFVCFPQTLAAYTMLRWRRVQSTIVYGVARSPEGGLIAHTWLEVGDGFVTGGDEAQGFAAIERWA
ncbi:MAG: lasso peptide biosynthesis B2 protein [Acidobacteriota bacterium]|nr:lasso peptide biosynthesis B2 protein [Acidobacteriota bacterium]